MDILQKVEAYVVSQLTEHLSSVYIYHNLSHTQRVVSSVKELAIGEQLTPEQTQIVELAAWFHDIGFINGFKGHEINSSEIAKDFLEGHNVSSQIISSVQNCILATNMESEPENILEKVLLDADCAHLGNSVFSEVNELLREEWNLSSSKKFTDSEWIDENINFFTKKHHYYTNYARINWQKIKDKNLSRLYKSRKKNKQALAKGKMKAGEFKLKKRKAEIPERGIETMFRVTLRNHINLSNIADTKANILLSVNAIIISMALSNLIPKLDNPSNHYLIIPTAIFVSFSLVSMGLSVLATRPNITSGKFTKKDVEDKKVNLLFFGNFHKVKLEEFEWAMGEMMEDRDYLYSSMKKDLYFLGLVLHKKYKILRVTYTIFLIGIIMSVIAFAVAFRTSGVTI
ncbi:HD domain-containing protein [Aureibaculum algae]|uniref:HD domain-containing protein n=1 Tax=Aureibaculum algae TaxID=2584122 RepID=A0A5B7TW90_9FLAO|nr:Pycsar system effector family protein [Aureibaculum algae]QCX40488.1 HD domain-containing protein [Aureibaculum algae]